MHPFDSVYCTINKERWLQEFLEKVDLEALLKQMILTKRYRDTHPDWDRPVVMYGIRKRHKCIKKQEIAVILDLMPWQQRSRMAETHWYRILYKRPATALEWQEMKMKESVRRYWIWSYFIENGWTVDKTVSHIVQDDNEAYGLDTQLLIRAFENYYGRKIRIYRRETAVQSELFR